MSLLHVVFPMTIGQTVRNVTAVTLHLASENTSQKKMGVSYFWCGSHGAVGFGVVVVRGRHALLDDVGAVSTR